MNEIEAVVEVHRKMIWFIYEIDDKPYHFEVPKTENNKMLKTGDKIMVFLAIALER